jgi:Fe-S cluster assembly protein SufD
MDHARADALAARSHLAAHGWIARHSEPFRHLPPPDAPVWLGPVDGDTWGELPLASGWRLQPAQSAGVQASWLDASDPAQRAELLAGMPLPGADPAAPFAWAHRALVRDGLRLRVAASGGAPLVLQLRRTPLSPVEAPLLVVELLPGAQCMLVEIHERECDAALVQNLQVHVTVGEGAGLRHVRVALPGVQDQLAHDVQARLERGASYDQCLLAAGSRYHLQRSVLRLAARDASVRSGSVLLAADSTLDHQVAVDHTAAKTTSSVEALALGAGTARIVANAQCTIQPGSEDAQTRQRLAGIPTSGQPKLVLRPHLEIHHDQVQAAHGATWGALPEDALFHARQRGLGEAQAKAMIVEGLAAAVLARAVDDPELPEEAGLERLLAAAIGRHLECAPKEGRHG